MNLEDLYNPDNICAIMTTKGVFVEKGPNQGFQETAGRYELWEKLEDGRLLKVKGWNKKATLAAYTKGGGERW